MLSTPTTHGTDLLILAVLTISSLAAIVGVVWFLRGKFMARVQSTLARYPKESWLAASQRATFFGQRSKGGKQVKGNGLMILTRKELHFHLLLPDREWTLPIASIQKVENPRSFMGKSILRPLLKLTYFDEAGWTDEIAFAVPDVAAWTKSLNALLAEREGRGGERAEATPKGDAGS